MTNLNLELPESVISIINDGCQELGISQAEFISRTITGYQMLVKSVLGITEIESESEIDEPQVKQNEFIAIIDGNEISGKNGKFLLINIINHLTPKAVYQALVDNDLEDQKTAIVQKTMGYDKNGKENTIGVEQNGKKWYVYPWFDRPTLNRKITGICEMMGLSCDIPDIG